MKPFFTILFAYVLLSAATGQTKWVFDDAHSSIRFTLTHLMVSDIEGSIKIREASLNAPDDLSNAQVNVIADVRTIDTDNDGRDEHLRSPDFFDADKYPDMVFRSSSFRHKEGNQYEVSGDLSFHGVTKPIIFEATATNAIRPYDNKNIIGFKVNGKLNRKDYNISAETPEALLSETVEIKGNFIFVKE